MNHVSVSPTNENGTTQGQRKTLTRVGIEPTTFGLDHLVAHLVAQSVEQLRAKSLKIRAKNARHACKGHNLYTLTIKAFDLCPNGM